MKKILLLTLLLASPLMGRDKKEPILGQSYVELGFNMYDSIIVYDRLSNQLNFGGQISFGIDWDFKSHIFSLEIFKPALSIAMDTKMTKDGIIPIGFGANIKFMEMSLGNKVGNYTYHIYFFGIGIFSNLIHDDSYAWSLGGLFGVTWTLPLGFKIVINNNWFVSFEHHIIGQFLDVEAIYHPEPWKPLAYNLSFTIGKRFDFIDSKIAGLK